MDTKQSLEIALRDAMRAKDELSLRTIRMVISAIKFNEIEKGKPLDETEVVSVLQKEVKSRREAIADAEKAGRPDLVDLGNAEIAVLGKFLPQQMSEQELLEMIHSAIDEVGAKSVADMGKVMKVLMPKIQGRVPGEQASQMVRSILAG
jgi:uncharacterized protein